MDANANDKSHSEPTFPAYLDSDHLGLRVLESAGNLVFLCNNEIIDYINPAGIRILHAITADNVVGRPISDFVDPDFGEMLSLGLEVFAEEDEAPPLKMQIMTGELIDMKMAVTKLDLNQDNDSTFMVECSDITEFIRNAESARMRQLRISGILKTVAESIVTTNEFGIIEAFNPAAEKLFGYALHEALGKNVSILMPEPHRSEHDDHLLNYLKTGEAKIMGQVLELEGKRKDDSIFPLELTVTELQESHDRKSFTAVIRDITERKHQEERIHFLAHHDALTGLPNRLLFGDRLKHSIKKTTRLKGILALMFIDLDRFKPINDTLGHEAGDIVLKGVAGRLTEKVRSCDTVARVGGDEFVIILENIQEKKNAGQVAGNIIQALVQPFNASGEECTVGASIGISLFPEDADNAEALIKCADETMYRVKEAGRNNFRYFSED